MLPGCGGGSDRPPLGRVTGRVTIDGQPFSGVIIAFLPESGRPATAVTDKDGKYDLDYLDEKGCKVGPNTIGFMVPTGGSPSHAIPKKYENKSDLVRDVKDGPNTFDFDLESDGEKPPPRAANPVVD